MIRVVMEMVGLLIVLSAGVLFVLNMAAAADGLRAIGGALP